MDTIFNRLKNRAISGLSNPDVVNGPDLKNALSEALEICASKEISDTLILDIAYYRFLLNVASEAIGEFESDCYSSNLKLVNKAPTRASNNPKTTKVCVVENGENEWL